MTNPFSFRRTQPNFAPGPFKLHKPGWFPRAAKALTSADISYHKRFKANFPMRIKAEPFMFNAFENASRPPRPLPTLVLQNNAGGGAETQTTTAPAQVPVHQALNSDLERQYSEDLLPDFPATLSRLDAMVVEFLEFESKPPPKAKPKKQARFKAALLQKQSNAITQIQDALTKLELQQQGNDGQPQDFQTQHQQLMQRAVDLAYPDCVRTLRTEPTDEPEQTGTEITTREEVTHQRRQVAKGLSQMRQRLDGGPQDKAKVSGAFLRAIANATDEATTLDQMRSANNLLNALSAGNARMVQASMTMQTDLPEVRAVLFALRSAYYSDVAALRFLNTMPEEHQNIIDVLKETGRSKGAPEDNPLARVTSKDITKEMPPEMTEALEAAIDKGKQVAVARTTYEDARDALVRVLGEAKTSIAETALIAAGAGIRVINPVDQEDGHLDGGSQSARKVIRSAAKHTKGAAFQIAKLAVSMEALAALDNEVLGHN